MAAARMQSPAAAMASPPYAASPVPQGTLAPGTRIMVGPVVVTVQKYLSQGGFAHVYLVTTDKPVPMPVSASSAPGAPQSTTRPETLHVLKRMAVPDKEALAGVRNEVDIHKSLPSHPNIVHFIEASATSMRGGGYEVFILMEYCAGGGIIDLMNARLRTRLSEPEVLKIFGDVAAGLSVMHHMQPPIMHRDLKVENILLVPPPRSSPSVGPTYKLCDFGSSKPLLSRNAAQTLDQVKLVEADLNKHTTLQYRAPEMVDVYQRRIIDEKADIWALGVLLYKLCYYTTPFEENGGGPLAILNARYRFPNSPPYSQRLKDLIASMLQEQSHNRPSIDEIMLRVHRMLGTQPPTSLLQKQARDSAAAPSASLPTRRSTLTTGSRPPAAGVTTDLIEVGQTEAERKRAEEVELKRRSDAITPMRRGRPTKGTATAAVAAKFEQPASSASDRQVWDPPKQVELPTSASNKHIWEPQATSTSSKGVWTPPKQDIPTTSASSKPVWTLPKHSEFASASPTATSPAPVSPPVRAITPPVASVDEIPAPKAKTRKPWQRDALEKEQVDSSGSSRSPSPPPLPSRDVVDAAPLQNGKPSKGSATAAAAAKYEQATLVASDRTSMPPPQRPASDNVRTSQMAPPPAWDEDDEEQHFLPQPMLTTTLSGRQTTEVSPGGTMGNLPRGALQSPSLSAAAKKYVDASTSPPPAAKAANGDDADFYSNEAAAARFPPIVPTASKPVPPPVASSQPASTPIVSPKLAPPPVVSPKPTQFGARQEIGGLVSRFEDVSMRREPSASSRVPPPIRSGSVRDRQQAFGQSVSPRVQLDHPGIKSVASPADSVNGHSSDGVIAALPPVEGSPAVIPSAKPAAPRSAAPLFKATTLPVVATDVKPIPLMGKPLKPWEREAMEKEQVEKFGSLRSSSPPKAKRVAPVDVGATERGLPAAGGKGEAQERFRGVSTLISQWQNNAQRNAPGWGTVGAAGDEAKGGHGAATSPVRPSSKDEDELFRRNASPRSLMQGRMHSREV